MKKKILLLSAGLLIAGLAFLKTGLKDSTGPLFMMRVEAMSGGENEGSEGAPFVFKCGVAIAYDQDLKPIPCPATVVLCQGKGENCTSYSCPVHSK